MPCTRWRVSNLNQTNGRTPLHERLRQFLKQTFGSSRNKAGTGDTGPFVPPVALQINSPHGAHPLALGRRKWRSQGGYATLTLCGLSLLEMLSLFVEFSRSRGRP